MNVIKTDLGGHLNEIEIIPIGDVHLGSGHFNKKAFESMLEYVLDEPNRFVVLNGDLVNNAIKTSVSDIYSEALNPDQALDKLTEYFEPLKDRILGIISGNHCDRTYKLVGIDLMKELTRRLGLYDKGIYSSIANIIFVSFGKSRGRETVRNTFSIYHSHGASGGRTMGAKTNAVHRMSQIVQADVYLHSHTHSPIVFKEDYYIANNANKGVGKVSRLFVNTNAYEGFGGYGERMQLRPSNMDFVTIKVTSDSRGNKYFNATL